VIHTQLNHSLYQLLVIILSKVTNIWTTGQSGCTVDPLWFAG